MRCHEELGTQPKNPRWSWSGRSADGKRVSVQLWQDLFTEGGKRYATGILTPNMPWVGTPGHRELIDNLIWARDRLDGIVSVIIVVAKDRKSEPRAIDRCFPQPKLQMVIRELDDTTGAFTLERI
jgi:hypothetical protein